MYSEVISPALAAPPPLPTYPQVSERQGTVGLFQGNPQIPLKSGRGRHTQVGGP